jgi:hypothetical protein
MTVPARLIAEKTHVNLKRGCLSAHKLNAVSGQDLFKRFGLHV